MKRLKKLFALLLIFLLVFSLLETRQVTGASALALSAPSSFKAEAFQYYNKISWADNNESFYYTVIEKSVDQGPFSPIATLYKGTVAFLDYSIANGHVYAYRARTFYLSSYSSYTPMVETITLYPTDFKILRALHDQVDLEWTYPALSLQRNPALETLIERRSSTESTWRLIAALKDNETFYRDASVDTDSYYYYRIRTRYSNGSYSHYLPSDYGLGTRTAYPLTTPLWGYAITDSQIRLEWDMSGLNGGTAIIQKRDTAGNFNTVFSSNYANTFIDTGLTKGQTYTYRLSLQSLHGMNSEFTEEIKIIAETVPMPTDLLANALSSDRIALSWAYPFEVETGFEVWRKSEGPWSLLAQLPKNTLSYEDSSCESNGSYSYIVRAKRGDTAYSAFSQQQAVLNEYPPIPLAVVPMVQGGILYLYSPEKTAPGTTLTLEHREGVNSEWTDFKSVNEGLLIAHIPASSSSGHFFRLRANKGSLESIGPEYRFFGSAPDPVQSLSAPYAGYKRVVLFWKDVTEKEEGFNIYRTTGGRRMLLGTAGRDAESFTDKFPVTGVSSYEVAPFNLSGESPARSIRVNVPKLVAYKDVTLSHWAHDAVYTLQGLGALDSAVNGYFNLQSPLSLGQVVSMILKSFSLPYEEQGLFTISDLAPGHAYRRDLFTAVKLGIVFPDGQGRIYPDKKVTKRDIAHLLNNTLNYLGKPLNAYDTDSLRKYDDYNEITEAEAHIMASLSGDGIITGSGSKLNLSAYATRAEGVTMIYRVLVKYINR